MEHEQQQQAQPQAPTNKRGVPASLKTWHDHLTEFRKTNPNTSLKQAMKDASDSYKNKKKAAEL